MIYESFLDDIDSIYPTLKILGDGKFKNYIEEIEDVREKGRRFIVENIERINTAEKEAEKNPSYIDRELLKNGGKYNFFSLIIPEEFGGKGIRTLPYAFFTEDMSSISSGILTIFGAHALGLLPIMFSPYIGAFSEFLKEIPLKEKDFPVIYALGLTEPTGGSDVQQDGEVLMKAKIITKAKKSKGGYIINGRKVFISNGSIANYITVAASPEPGKMMWFLLDSSYVKVSRVEDKMGQKTSPTAELVFDDIFVPDDMILADEDIGPKNTEMILSVSRAPVGAIATGIAKGLIKITVDIIRKSYNDFNNFQAYKIAEALSKLYIARQIWISACIFIDFFGPMSLQKNIFFKLLLKSLSNIPKSIGRFIGEKGKEMFLKILSKNIEKVEIYSSIAKAYSSWISYEICQICMELLEEKGIDKSEIAERLWRDIKLTHIYETTNEVNNLIIFKKLFGKSGVIL